MAQGSDTDPFADRLMPGERVVWSGRPTTGLMFTPRDCFLVPFSILWLGFAIFWTVAATAVGGGLQFSLFGLMFVAVGSFFMIGRFWVDAWLRGGTRYALTDRRVLIAKPRPFSDFTAVSLDRLPDARLSERKNGRGSIRFGQPPSVFGSSGFSMWAPAFDPTPQFLAIPDARHVFDLVQRSSSRAA